MSFRFAIALAGAMALVLAGCAQDGAAPAPGGAAEEGAIVFERVGVVDGDTLRASGRSFRLHGIDAPERDQTCGSGGGTWACGAEARARLQALVGNGAVSCTPQDIDRYGRIVARCHAGGADIGAEMVAGGLALAYRQYSRRYVPQEEAARAAGLGMWSGSFIAPWDWRRP